MLQAISAGWERIRTEVKAADRKVEALLASTDPGRVTGDALYIIAAYPFHASKLNEARVRNVVEDAVERVTGRRLRASFILKDDLPGTPAITTAPKPPSLSSPPTHEPPPARATNGIHEDEPPFDEDPDPPSDDEFIRNVKTILDAEEVFDPEEIAKIP